MRSRLAAALACLALVAVAFAADAPKPHPYFNDQGALSWSVKLADAQSAAKSHDKLIFIEYGREACGNCKALCQNVLTDSKIKERLAKLCVGLAADCDHPENDVRKILTDNLKGAGMLPFAGFVTPDMQWIGGSSGYKTVEEFDAILSEVEKSPLLQAKPETAKKLDAFAAQAEKSAEKSDWKNVFAAAKSAADLKGRSPAKDKIAALVVKAREWADAEMTKQVDSVKTGGDRAAVRAALTKLSSMFSGEPEGKDADNGAKAIAKLAVIEGLPAEQQDAAREKATKDFAASRWVAVFDKSVPKPAEKPADGK